MKRFRIREDMHREIVKMYDTTQECFDWLENKGQTGLNSYTVECAVDDIEISDREFMEAFYDGESPNDLQFF